MLAALSKAAILGGIPSMFMLVSTCIGLGKAVPENVAGALQHFAAGVLLCTVGTELLPAMVNAKGFAENLAACIGFFLGMGLLILLANMLPECPDESECCESQRERIKKNKKGDDDKGGGDDSDDETTTYEIDGVQDAVASLASTPHPHKELQRLRFVIGGRRYRQRQHQHHYYTSATASPAGQQIYLKRSERQQQSKNNSSSSPSSPSSPSQMEYSEEGRPLLITVSKIDTNDNNNDCENAIKSNGNNNYQTNNEKSKKDIDNDNDNDELESLRDLFDKNHQNSNTDKVFPLAFVIAVAIDSSLDGLLIGIASAAGPSAGPMMSASLSVEMSFLGLTLATALYGQSTFHALLAALLGPACRKFHLSLGG